MATRPAVNKPRHLLGHARPKRPGTLFAGALTALHRRLMSIEIHALIGDGHTAARVDCDRLIDGL
jgi:hypothetical protein